MIVFGGETKGGQVSILGILRHDEVSRIATAPLTIPMEVIANAAGSGGKTLADVKDITLMVGEPGDTEEIIVAKLLAGGCFSRGIELDDRRPEHAARRN